MSFRVDFGALRCCPACQQCMPVCRQCFAAHNHLRLVCLMQHAHLTYFRDSNLTCSQSLMPAAAMVSPAQRQRPDKATFRQHVSLKSGKQQCISCLISSPPLPPPLPPSRAATADVVCHAAGKLRRTRAPACGTQSCSSTCYRSWALAHGCSLSLFLTLHLMWQASCGRQGRQCVGPLRAAAAPATGAGHWLSAAVACKSSDLAEQLTMSYPSTQCP